MLLICKIYYTYRKRKELNSKELYHCHRRCSLPHPTQRSIHVWVYQIPHSTTVLHPSLMCYCSKTETESPQHFDQGVCNLKTLVSHQINQRYILAMSNLANFILVLLHVTAWRTPLKTPKAFWCLFTCVPEMPLQLEMYPIIYQYRFRSRSTVKIIYNVNIF